MAQDGELRAKQQGVAARMALALAVAVVAVVLALRFGTGGPAPTLEACLRAWALTDLSAAVWLAAAIANVARLRFVSRTDIDGGAAPSESEAVRVGRAVIQNTLEQLALAAPVHAALALELARPAPLLAALGGLFGVGRLLFWAGYRRGAAARALGFALTFYPTLVGLAVAALAATTGLWR